MALFAYRAVDEEGRISSGSLDATNAIDLELRLRRLGLDLITFESVKRSTTTGAAGSSTVIQTLLVSKSGLAVCWVARKTASYVPD